MGTVMEVNRIDKIEKDLYGHAPGCFMYELLELKFKFRFLNSKLTYLNSVATLILISLIANLFLR